MYIFAAILLFAVAASGQNDVYKAVLVLYRPINIGDNIPATVTRINVNNVVQLLSQAKDKHDIAVVPEYALSNRVVKSYKMTYLSLYSTKIGNVNDQVCNDTARGSDTVSKLACAAKDNNIHLIVNLIEDAGNNKFYMTNVGFDRNGAISVKCRHLHVNETYFTKAADQNGCSFTAAFKEKSVKFTVLSASDIMYPIPDAIKSDNVIMTSSILNSLPLEMGLTMYQAFAVANGVNLLVAGYTDTTEGYGGSGIFQPDGNATVSVGPATAPTNDSFGQLFANDVPVKASTLPVISVNSISTKGDISTIKMKYAKLPELNSTVKELKNCSGERCCNFKAEIEGNSIEPYRWTMVSNKMVLLEQEVEVLLCTISVPSENSQRKDLNNISISTTLEKSRKSLTMPIILNKDFLPADFLFNREKHSITLNKKENIVIFGIMEIIGDLSPSSSSNTTLIVVIVLLILVLVGLLVTFVIWRKRQAKNRRNF